MVSIFYRSGLAYNAVDDLLSRDLFEDIYISFSMDVCRGLLNSVITRISAVQERK